jgi:DNA-cytosine methyltransferase
MQLRYAELFAGLGIGSLAIKEVFPDARCAFYSEIEKHRNSILAKNHPGVKNVGNIEFVNISDLPGFDLMIGGSPCQDLSIARSKREGLDGHESGLFYQYLEVLAVKKPKYFVLENVASMSRDDRLEITKQLAKVSGQIIKPVEINSLYFTGQARKRLYWCNFPILQAPDKAVDPRHCIDKSVPCDRPTEEFIDVNALHSAYTIKGKLKDPKSLANGKSNWDLVSWSRSTRYKTFQNEEQFKEWQSNNPGKVYKTSKPNGKVKISYVEQRIKINLQANTLLTGNGCSIFSSRNFVRNGNKMRTLTPLECARLQGISDGYLEGLKSSTAYKVIGDAFTLPVITHIMKSLKAHIESV